MLEKAETMNVEYENTTRWFRGYSALGWDSTARHTSTIIINILQVDIHSAVSTGARQIVPLPVCCG